MNIFKNIAMTILVSDSVYFTSVICIKNETSENPTHYLKILDFFQFNVVQLGQAKKF